jgi:quercetin dioxygenase-like cupin family protein/DNA-binding XRE family transcriptional regulator
MIGSKLRLSRQEKKLTISQLAQKCGFSISYISSVERGHVNPSLAALLKITSALEIDPGFLFDGNSTINNAKNDVVIKSNNRLKLIYPHSGFHYELLTKNLSTKKVEFLRLVMPVGTSSGPEPLVHYGEEYGLILKGKLELILGNEVHILEKDDSFSFLSTTPHRISNVGHTTAEAVWAHTPPRL